MNLRCHERDKRKQRCTVTGQHQEITNSEGKRALVHETRASMWTTPIPTLLEVVQALPTEITTS